MKTSQSTHPRPPVPLAFTLVEVIGALALMALVVGVVTHSTLAKVSQSNRDKEAGDLTMLARAFETAVIRTRTIPQSGGRRARMHVLGRVERRPSKRPAAGTWEAR